MPSGTIKISLRPLKLAFLVNPSNTKALLEIIQINSFLWGGTYNPIIPALIKKPKYWDPVFPFKAQNIIDGYIDAYNPDIVVYCDESANSFKIKDQTIIQLNELLPNAEDKHNTAFGINLLNVLRKYYLEEGRFLQKEPFNIIIPEIKHGKYELFLSSIFGKLPQNIDDVFKKNVDDKLEIMRPQCVFDDYIQFFKPVNLYPTKISRLYTSNNNRPTLNARNFIFFMDSTSNIDIVDYWNLRAIGCNIIPISKQLSNMPDLIQFSQNFIQENYFPSQHGRHPANEVSIIKSRTVHQDDVTNFYKKISNDLIKEKYLLQTWYPKIWDARARETEKIMCCKLETKTKVIEISNQKEISVETISTDLINQYDYNGNPKFANEINLNIRDDNGEIFSQVIPNGNSELARLFIPFGLHWRCGNGVLVNLSTNSNVNYTLIFPEAHTVFSAWLRSHGFDSQLSSAGLLAKSIFKQLKGIWGVELLANKEILSLLDKMSGGRTNLDRLSSALKDEFKHLGQDILTKKEISILIEKHVWTLSESESSGIKHQALIATLNKIIKKEGKRFTADIYLKNLIDANILRLGKEIQCSNCQRFSWYPLDALSYILTCTKCTESFRLPQESCDEIKWSYHPVGSLRQPRYAGGAYCVLLVMRFFSRTLDATITPYLSFNANCGDKKIEADLAIFYQKRFKSSENHLIFIESKSFNSIEKIDIERMQVIANLFPGSVIVFATLKDELSTQEKKLIKQFVNFNRKRWSKGQKETPVVILGATELFCNEPSLCSTWESKGGAHKDFSQMYDYSNLEALSDYTLKIYLNLPSAMEFARDIQITRSLSDKHHLTKQQ